MNVVITSRALIINPENKLLLVTHEGDDFYYTPGGKWETDHETLQECAQREVYEEIGIKINLDKLIYVHEYVSDHHGTPEKFLVFFFFGKSDQEQPKDWHDSGGKSEIIAKYLSQEEIKNLEKIYPKFLQAQFWHDLENNFQNHNSYVDQI